MTKAILSLTLALFTLTLFAQVPATFRPSLLPEDAVVKIDNQLVKNGEAINLSSGQYLLEVWAPRFSLITDTVQLEAGKTFVYRKGLKKLDDNYEVYREELKDYRNFKLNQNLTIFGYGAVSVGLGLIVLDARNKGFSELLQKADDVNARIANAINPEQLALDTEIFNQLQEDYRKKRNTRNVIIAVGTPLAITAIGLSVREIIRTSKRKPRSKPNYEPQNPFARALNSITPRWNFSAISGNQVGFCITF